MKKTVKFIFLISILSLLFIAINVQAVHDSWTRTYFIRIDPVEDVKSGSITVNYDTTALQITKGYWEFKARTADFNTETSEGAFTFSEPTTLDDLIFGMIFIVKPTAEERKYDIIVNIKLINYNNEETQITKKCSLEVKCDHEFSEKIVENEYLKSEATCAVAATYYKSCKYCGKAGMSIFTNGNTLEHEFDKKIEDTAYVSKPGTCTTKTEYYYACSGCDAKGTKTYAGSETPSHLWSDNWHKDTNNHWHKCNNCIEKKDVAAHKYDDYVIVKEPTTEVEGLRKYTCICGEETLEVIPKLPVEEPDKKGCKEDVAALVVGIISLSMAGILLKKKENIL